MCHHLQGLRDNRQTSHVHFLVQVRHKHRTYHFLRHPAMLQKINECRSPGSIVPQCICHTLFCHVESREHTNNFHPARKSRNYRHHVHCNLSESLYPRQYLNQETRVAFQNRNPETLTGGLFSGHVNPEFSNLLCRNRFHCIPLLLRFLLYNQIPASTHLLCNYHFRSNRPKPDSQASQTPATTNRM